MTIRLLILTQGYPWRQNLAGIFHRETFRLFAESGLAVTVVTPIPWVPALLARMKPRWRSYAELPSRQSENGLAILRPRYFALPRENAWFVPEITRDLAVRSLRLARHDVIQAFFAFPDGVIARRLARRWQVPYVVGMLGDDVNIYPHQRARNLRLLTEVVRDAAFAFANGPTLAETARRLTGIPVETLSIGALPARFAKLPSRAEARLRLGWPLDRPIALYVGSLIPTKGIGELAAALDLLPEAMLLVALGDGPMRAELARRNNALCVGVRSAEEVTCAMAAADVLVHPSHYEGLPTVLVEAGFARLPIVTTDAPGCIDLARDERARMVPVGDVPALARALAAAVADPESMRRMTERMYAHVQQYYDLDNNAAKLIKIYHEIARPPTS